MKLYSLEQVLDRLTNNSPHKYTAANLADLCLSNDLTPLFRYSGYISKATGYDDDGEPIYSSDYENSIVNFSGYLAHDDLINLIDGYSDAIEVGQATLCSFNDGALIKGDTVRLLARPYRVYGEFIDGHDYNSADHYTVKLNNVRFAASEVDKHWLVSYGFDDLITPEAQLEEAQATIEAQQQRIEELEEQLAGKTVRSDDKDLRPNSQSGVARMLYALLIAHKYELTPEGKGKTNQIIVEASEQCQTSVTENFVAGWLKKAYQLSIDANKTK